MADETNPQEAASAESLIEGEDFYFEGAYVVFTEAYHLKRGECCNSGCRHCPYRNSDEDYT